MKRILVLAGDLNLSSKIREAVLSQEIEYSPIRSIEDLEGKVDDDDTARIILDLNSQRLDAFALISAVKEQGKLDKVICFYSHVNHELAHQAQSLGITEIYPRSKFFNDLVRILSLK